MHSGWGYPASLKTDVIAGLCPIQKHGGFHFPPLLLVRPIQCRNIRQSSCGVYQVRALSEEPRSGARAAMLQMPVFQLLLAGCGHEKVGDDQQQNGGHFLDPFRLQAARLPVRGPCAGQRRNREHDGPGRTAFPAQGVRALTWAAGYRKFNRPFLRVWQVGSGRASAALGTDRAQIGGSCVGFRHRGPTPRLSA